MGDVIDFKPVEEELPPLTEEEELPPLTEEERVAFRQLRFVTYVGESRHTIIGVTTDEHVAGVFPRQERYVKDSVTDSYEWEVRMDPRRFGEIYEERQEARG